MDKDNWHIEKVMAKVMQSQPDKLNLKPDFHCASVHINHDTLSQCLITLAHIVKEHGDDYLPIFERIKNELDEHRHSQSIKDLALDMAGQHSKNSSLHENAQHLAH